jgi:hypothetical protein
MRRLRWLSLSLVALPLIDSVVAAQSDGAERSRAVALFHGPVSVTAFRGAEPLVRPAGGVLTPTYCRISADRDGSVVVAGPGANGALTCQVVLSWSEYPGATAYESRAEIERPCARARGGPLGRTSEILAFVTSPYGSCSITYVVYALAGAAPGARPVRIDSTVVLHIRAVGARS